jgi:hypothetical protein
MPDVDGKGDRIGGIRHPREAAMARLAGRQEGVVSQEQLYELGFSVKQIELRVSQGRLHPWFHNVYAVGTPQLSPHAQLRAALLSVGPDAFLSHRTAAGAWGLRVINTHAIEVTVPGTGGRRRSDLTVHRTRHDPHPHDIRVRTELRVSSTLRLLVELAPRESTDELERLITVAIRKRLLRPDAADGLAAIEAALARHQRRPGMRKLAAAFGTYRRIESHASQLELAFDQFLVAHSEIPCPVRNVTIDRWEVDRCWPARKLIVELDGRPYHLAARDMERDRLKDTALQRLGWTVMRISDFRFEHDLPGILRDLHHFLGIQRAAERRALARRRRGPAA